MKKVIQKSVALSLAFVLAQTTICSAAINFRDFFEKQENQEIVDAVFERTEWGFLADQRFHDGSFTNSNISTSSYSHYISEIITYFLEKKNYNLDETYTHSKNPAYHSRYPLANYIDLMATMLDCLNDPSIAPVIETGLGVSTYDEKENKPYYIHTEDIALAGASCGHEQTILTKEDSLCYLIDRIVEIENTTPSRALNPDIMSNDIFLGVLIQSYIYPGYNFHAENNKTYSALWYSVDGAKAYREHYLNQEDTYVSFAGGYDTFASKVMERYSAVKCDLHKEDNLLVGSGHIVVDKH